MTVFVYLSWRQYRSDSAGTARHRIRTERPGFAAADDANQVPGRHL